MGLVTVWSLCIITKCYWEILTSLCKHSSGGMDVYHSNYCTLNQQLSARLLTPPQPPPDFQPPTYGYHPTNRWYHGQLRETQGVFDSLYVQFQYSRKLTDQFVCASDTLHLLSVNHVVLCNGNVHSIVQCCNIVWVWLAFGSLFMSITSCFGGAATFVTNKVVQTLQVQNIINLFR